MNISKLFLVGAVSLAGLLATSTAQANDHHLRQGDHHDHHHYRGHAHHYHARTDYHPQQSAVVNGTVDDGYSNDVTIAFGGHRTPYHHYRH